MKPAVHTLSRNLCNLRVVENLALSKLYIGKDMKSKGERPGKLKNGGVRKMRWFGATTLRRERGKEAPSFSKRRQPDPEATIILFKLKFNPNQQKLVFLEFGAIENSLF